jgi:hypothetical protein
MRKGMAYEVKKSAAFGFVCEVNKQQTQRQRARLVYCSKSENVHNFSSLLFLYKYDTISALLEGGTFVASGVGQFCQ